ncbi:hypothetical protein C8D77_11186 [Mesorhizobium loti]|uniref:Uncharacterized protein n=1 Tax=Rhizobium loti TaxID=381 RepID=A0A8E2WAE2_RHILI|nr:hypothetical protein [Mesorhizobium loti]PWJ88364.1 hypothetical protein C8D77_11186 [Mesorhizobium loti]
MTDLETAIAAQFQIGDLVVYTPESVRTRISGYVWATSIGKPPTIISYELECGIAVGADLLCRAPPASGGFVTHVDVPLGAIREHTAAAMRAAARMR